ncbi:transcriptional regulator [Desulfosarcina alkanivorans]|uniref:Transcriptional regulator n=1 Tax=Desulfosarcina alkanivorans TaxID=571177 RepID=A0A5K7YWD4_9BACT|nr:Lrp/AsnC family transcriptional regulator [Desulfosarcina alkanivorans]BBO68987.1 transcriptional regulator [Desulfosarcina alkanivorans]
MLNLPIDDIDAEIINMLKKNGRTPNTEIANVLNRSETAIRKRLKRLLDEEIIQIVAVVNQKKLGYEIEGNIRIKTDIKKTGQVKRELEALDRVWYIAQITGSSDFDVEFNARSQDDLRTLIENVNRIDGVLQTDVSIRLQLVKNRYDWEK